jgi:hypothetical protein
MSTRHNSTAVQQLEKPMEELEGVESDDTKSGVVSVGTALQYLDVSVVHTKNMLDDYGQKCFHTFDQFDS